MDSQSYDPLRDSKKSALGYQWGTFLGPSELERLELLRLKEIYLGKTRSGTQLNQKWEKIQFVL